MVKLMDAKRTHFATISSGWGFPLSWTRSGRHLTDVRVVSTSANFKREECLIFGPWEFARENICE